MRLNFTFKDALVRRKGKSSFDIVFDVSRLSTKILSNDSRIYVESVNLCEFMDKFTKEDLNGFLEIRCNAIGAEDEWDSGSGNTGDTLVYRAPMENYQVFNNPNPMFVYNFKIQKSFFSHTIIFTIDFFDIHGNPFETFESSEKVVDRTHVSYTNYSTKLGQISDKNTELSNMEILLEEAKDNVNSFRDDANDRENAYGEELGDLLVHITEQRDNARSDSVRTTWNAALNALGPTSTELSRIDWFDNFLDLSVYPYNRTDNGNKTLLENAKQHYIEFWRVYSQYSAYSQAQIDLLGSSTFVPLKYTASLVTPANRFQPIFPPAQTFTYTTEGNSKTGSIVLEVVNFDTLINVVIKSITPASTLPVENEVLIISGDQFTAIDILNGASDLRIKLDKIVDKSSRTLENEKIVLETELEVLRNALTYTVNVTNVELGDNLNDVIKSMSLSFVIYDELNPNVQASTDAVKGNTYQRILPCNAKRF